MEELALSGRALALVPPPDKHQFAAFSKWVMSNMKLLFPNLPVKLQQWSFDQYNERGNFDKATKMANTKAYYNDLLRTTPNKKLVSKWSTFKSFVKDEKMAKCTLFGPEPDTRPRFIQGCTPQAAVSTGMWMCAFQEYLHSEWSTPWLKFAAGSNLDQISDWLNENFADKQYFYEDDFTLYDSTFSKSCHDLVMKIYEQAGLKDEAWAWAIRKAQVNSRGFTRQGHKYVVEGTMKSGVADTCLSNSIVNGLSHLYAIHKTTGLGLKQIFSQISMTLMGDDNLIMTSLKLNVAAMSGVIRGLGLVPKLHQKQSVEDVVFLNNRPYPTPDGYQFAPRIGRLLQRLGWATDKKVSTAYTHAVYKAFAKSCAHVPVLNKLISQVLAVTKHFDHGLENSTSVKKELQYQLASSNRDLKVTSASYDFLSRVYGVSQVQVQQAENDLATIRSVPCYIGSNALEMFILVDQ
jgi:hypothetical protein